MKQLLYNVIFQPVVTEKSMRAMEEKNVYTFIVNHRANKMEIADAVEELWGVTVEDVRTMRYGGKVKRSYMGQVMRNWAYGRRPQFKKALVRLAEGDHVEFYEVG